MSQPQPVPSDESSHPDNTNTVSAAEMREAIPARESSPTFRIVAVVLLAGVLPCLVAVVARSLFRGAYVHEFLHECVELAGTCIALAVATLLWLRSQYEKESPHLMWAAAALVAMGLIDGAHAVAPFGIAWSWLRHSATLVGGLLFAMVWLARPWLDVRRKNFFLAGVAVLSVATALLIGWKPGLMPAPWTGGDYSLAVKAVNGLGGLGFLAAAVFFLRRYLRRRQIEDLVLASQTLLFGVAGLLFGYSHIWHAGWWVWHGARLVAYGILLVTAYEVMVGAEEEIRSLGEAVRAERLRFNDVLNQLPAYVVLLSKDYHVPFANRYFEEQFGKSEGRRCYEYLFQRAEPCANCETYKVLKTNAPHGWEWTGPNGRDYDIHDFPFTDSDGSTLIMEMGIDITERKEAERRLTEQQYYTRSLIEASLDPLVTISPAGKITDVNRATEAVTGVERERLIGSDFCDYFSEPGKARAGYQQVFADGLVQNYPLAIRHTSGRLTDVLYNATVFRNQKGEVEGVFAAARDITERKRTEVRLREQAALLELAPAAILVRDLGSRIVYWSRGAEDLYGWSREEVLGQVTHEVLRAKYPRPVTEIEGSVLHGEGWEGELEHTTRAGRQITVSSRWAPQYDENRQAIGFLEINLDITERKRAEQDLQRYMQELERSNAELQDFASIASHDLQEPLRKVLAFGDHLREHLGSNLDELGSDFLGRMQNAARRMSGLIEGLLEYSRVTTRAQPFQPVDMTQAVFGVLVDMEERIRQSHAQVEFQPMPKVLADPTQVRQLLQNLLGNALKFQPPGKTPQVELKGERGNGWCEISVHDNGIGFDEKYLDRIFRPFQRLHGRNEYEGSGMGLAICRKVVARHGGEITAHSRPGEGSTFVVTLPSAPAATTGREMTWETKPESSSESCSPKTMTTTSS
jgi:PAS domain S-box-containing protein